ncbi:hypothetical protein [Paenibacillus pini]|uniref:Uncharacterized protein n=1 Tax=Paenibacillus pini JCM 16418 TaxID=1236976 RepID=W7YL48_9BACL|nr:hypothetical protein [Paenibacillus pini]GAF09252.1 hypothetical protein JCM16418_3376 [Paenibacillus pini JCM 16418]
MKIHIPGQDTLLIHHLVLDFNGTIALDRLVTDIIDGLGLFIQHHRLIPTLRK